MKVTKKANQSYSISTRYREITVEKAKVQPGRGKDGILGTADIWWHCRQQGEEGLSPCTEQTRDAIAHEEYTIRREDGEIVYDLGGDIRRYDYDKERWQEAGEVEEYGEDGLQTVLTGWGGVRAWLLSQKCPGN